MSSPAGGGRERDPATSLARTGPQDPGLLLQGWVQCEVGGPHGEGGVGQREHTQDEDHGYFASDPESQDDDVETHRDREGCQHDRPEQDDRREGGSAQQPPPQCSASHHTQRRRDQCDRNPEEAGPDQRRDHPHVERLLPSTNTELLGQPRSARPTCGARPQHQRGQGNDQPERQQGQERTSTRGRRAQARAGWATHRSPPSRRTTGSVMTVARRASPVATTAVAAAWGRAAMSMSVKSR